jgi:hypothetical protein
MAGSACAPDERNILLLDYQTNVETVSFLPGRTGTITLYCPISNVEVDGSPINLGIYFVDTDGSGAASQVAAAIYRVSKLSGARSVVCSYRSNVDGNPADLNWQADTKSCFTAGSPAAGYPPLLRRGSDLQRQHYPESPLPRDRTVLRMEGDQCACFLSQV